jgi:hypothetical protein
MIERGEIDQARFRLIKTARAAIRLHHSLNADDELNVKLPELVKAFDEAINKGVLPDDTTMKEIVGEVLGD